MSYARVEAEMARVNDVLCAISLLDWDANIGMPASGTQTRGQQIATLVGVARAILTSHKLRAAIDVATGELAMSAPDDPRHRALDQTRAAADLHTRIPAKLLANIAELKTNAQQVWAEARRQSDFSAFAPFLKRIFALQRELAEAIGYADHPYDALLGRYEPGATLKQLRSLFEQLKAGIKPLIARALSEEQPRSDFLERSYPVERQRTFAREVATRMGFDFGRGRLDDTAHPFETAFTRNDVRLAGRFSDTNLANGLFAVWHEAGHGMYEQGIDPGLTRTALAMDLINLEAIGGVSLGMHESQSRLWENRIGRSRRFWVLHFDELKSVFAEQLADVSAEEFWRAVNIVKPGLIRVEADELTYDFHIMLRTEIEADLLAGDLQVEDLPAIWAEKMRDHLGVTVPDDRRGVLQDIHWAGGMIGGFPGYTLGNVIASQLMASASADPAIDAGLERGDYAPLAQWLNQHIHRHGRSKTVDEILLEATGSTIDPGPYLTYLQSRNG